MTSSRKAVAALFIFHDRLIYLGAMSHYTFCLTALLSSVQSQSHIALGFISLWCQMHN